jgi:hypothetical protein
MTAAHAASSAVPPQARVLQMVMGGWVSRAITEATKFGVPDIIKEHGPLTAAEIVAKGGVAVVPDALERLLRACASLGLFTEDTAGRFGATELSEPLTSDAPESIKKLVEASGGHWLRILYELSGAVTTGRSQADKIYGMGWWDFLNANPKEMEDFGESMKANSLNSLRGVLEHCDFSGVRTVADVGGGFGHLAVALLEKYPALHATVVDVPELTPLARQRFSVTAPAISGRLEYVGGNMFESVPPAEVYIMKHIIHDWTDERCLQLLRNCYKRMDGNGRVICVDAVLPPLGDTGGMPAKLLDLLMLAGIDGKERTEAQWRALYRAAGFEISSITPIHDNFGTSIVEGVRRAES